MNQLVLLFIVIAVIFGGIGLGGEGETSRVIWVIFFGSAAAAFYVYWKNRGEGQGSSRGYGPGSSGSDQPTSSGSNQPTPSGSDRKGS